MKSKRIFIISCYFDGSNNAILDCVASIKKYYLNPKIVVIDSNSPDKTYFNKLRKDNVIVLNSKNKNYDTGAYWIGFKKFSNYEYFYLAYNVHLFQGPAVVVGERDPCAYVSWNGLTMLSMVGVNGLCSLDRDALTHFTDGERSWKM